MQDLPMFPYRRAHLDPDARYSSVASYIYAKQIAEMPPEFHKLVAEAQVRLLHPLHCTCSWHITSISQ